MNGYEVIFYASGLFILLALVLNFVTPYRHKERIPALVFTLMLTVSFVTAVIAGMFNGEDIPVLVIWDAVFAVYAIVTYMQRPYFWKLFMVISAGLLLAAHIVAITFDLSNTHPIAYYVYATINNGTYYVQIIALLILAVWLKFLPNRKI